MFGRLFSFRGMRVALAAMFVSAMMAAAVSHEARANAGQAFTARRSSIPAISSSAPPRAGWAA